jgi:hypothetical protein
LPKRHFRVDPPADATQEQLRAWNDLNRQLTELTDALYNIQVESGGTFKFVEDGTVWDDLRVPLTTAKLAGGTNPDYSTFTTGSLYAYLFDAAALQEITFTVQMPHSYKLGTDIYPHLHWTPVNANTGTVSWALEYSWADIGSQFRAPSTIHVRDAANLKTYGHQYADFGPISPPREAGNKVSSILVCRVYRYASDTLDTYASDAALLEIDFHFEIDTIGSREEKSK